MRLIDPLILSELLEKPGCYWSCCRVAKTRQTNMAYCRRDDDPACMTFLAEHCIIMAEDRGTAARK